MSTVLAFLRSLDLFNGLAEEHLRLLADQVETRAFEAGQTIIGPEQKVRGLFILASGRAKLFTLLPDGKEQTIYVFGPGEPFCLCWAFDQERFPASAAALERSTVYVIAREALERIAEHAPGLLFNMVLLLSHRLKEAMERIRTLSTRDAGQRVALFLLGLALQQHGQARVLLPITHRELAKVLGLTPEALSRTFRKLGETGLVQVDGKAVVILSRSRLEGFAVGQDEPV